MGTDVSPARVTADPSPAPWREERTHYRWLLCLWSSLLKPRFGLGSNLVEDMMRAVKDKKSPWMKTTSEAFDSNLETEAMMQKCVRGNRRGKGVNTFWRVSFRTHFSVFALHVWVSDTHDLLTRDGLHRHRSTRQHAQQTDTMAKSINTPTEKERGVPGLYFSLPFSRCASSQSKDESFSVTCSNWIFPFCVTRNRENISSSLCFCIMLVIWVVSCAPRVNITPHFPVCSTAIHIFLFPPFTC